MGEKMPNSKQKYEKNRQVKRVSFNVNTEKELLEFANSIPDFSNWAKQKLIEEKACAE